MTLFGFNDTEWDYDFVKQRAFENPGGVYVCFTPTQCMELQWLTDYKATTIWRIWPDEDNLDIPGIDYANYAYYEMKQHLGDQFEHMKQYIYVQYVNEPVGNYQKLADETLSAMNRARELGLHMAVLTFGHGHPEPEDIENYFLPVFEDLQDGYHIWNPHEYYDVDTPKDFEFNTGDPYNFDLDNWQLGRYNFTLDILDKHGIEYPDIAFAEFQFDSTNHSEIKGHKAVMRNRGWTVYDIISFLQKAMKKYARIYKTGNLLGFSWFGQRKQGSSNQWHNFSLDEPELIAALNTMTIPVEEEPMEYEGILKVKVPLNVRIGAGVGYGIIEKIPANSEFPANYETKPIANGYHWAFISSEHYRGYIATGPVLKPASYAEWFPTTASPAIAIRQDITEIRGILDRISSRLENL